MLQDAFPATKAKRAKKCAQNVLIHHATQDTSVSTVSRSVPIPVAQLLVPLTGCAWRRVIAKKAGMGRIPEIGITGVIRNALRVVKMGYVMRFQECANAKRVIMVTHVKPRNSMKE